MRRDQLEDVGIDRMAIKHAGSIKKGEVLDQLSGYQFLKNIPAPWN
jgi:hypothetical protein